MSGIKSWAGPSSLWRLQGGHVLLPVPGGPVHPRGLLACRHMAPAAVLSSRGLSARVCVCVCVCLLSL